MAFVKPRWLRRENATHGRHVRVMPATTVPGAAPALVATAAQAVIAVESAADESGAVAVAPPASSGAAPVQVLEALEVEAPVAEPHAADVPLAGAEDPVTPATDRPTSEVPEPVATAAVEPPPFEPPPWDLPAPTAPPVPAADPAPSPFGGPYEPHPVALEFSDGARFELDEDDPRFASFLAAAAAVTGAAHDRV